MWTRSKISPQNHSITQRLFESTKHCIQSTQLKQNSYEKTQLYKATIWKLQIFRSYTNRCNLSANRCKMAIKWQSCPVAAIKPRTETGHGLNSTCFYNNKKTTKYTQLLYIIHYILYTNTSKTKHKYKYLNSLKNYLLNSGWVCTPLFIAGHR